MKVESKYAKKQREIAAPYTKKAKFFMNITRVMSIITILFIVVMLGINSYANVLMGVAAVMAIATAIVFANFQTNDKIATRTEAVANQIDDFIENYDLTASEVEAIDQMIEDTLNDKYTLKFEDVCITFGQDIIFAMYKDMDLNFLSICEIAGVTEIQVTKYYTPTFDSTDYAFDFVDKKEMILILKSIQMAKKW